MNETKQNKWFEQVQHKNMLHDLCTNNEVLVKIHLENIRILSSIWISNLLKLPPSHEYPDRGIICHLPNVFSWRFSSFLGGLPTKYACHFLKMSCFTLTQFYIHTFHLPSTAVLCWLMTVQLRKKNKTMVGTQTVRNIWKKVTFFLLYSQESWLFN